MADDQAFLTAIVADPANSNRRLIYADWLEERGDEESLLRAEYLRAELLLDAVPKGAKKPSRLQKRLKDLQKLVGNDWWRQLDSSKVDYCVTFAYRCPHRWDTLEPTNDPNVRHCGECERDVHYCRNSAEARSRVSASQLTRGKCVFRSIYCKAKPAGCWEKWLRRHLVVVH